MGGKETNINLAPSKLLVNKMQHVHEMVKRSFEMNIADMRKTSIYYRTLTMRLSHVSKGMQFMIMKYRG